MNNSGVADTIVFDIPGPGPHFIKLATPLSLITGGLSILNNRAGDESVHIGPLDASTNIRIFETVPGATVTLAGLIIANGRAAGSGSAILNRASNMTVRECTIVDNRFGAVRNIALNGETTTLEMIDCSFSTNDGSIGGAIRSAGPAGNAGGHTLLVTNCTFRGNTADSGGAIYNDGFALVTNCTFNANSAKAGSAGGIYNTAIGNLTLRSCTFVENTSTGAGSAFFNDGGIMNFGNNIFRAQGASASVARVPGGGAFLSTGGNISSDAAGGGSGTAPAGILNGNGDRRNTDPMVDLVLTPYGGRTATHALLPGSPAINTADSTRTPARDQRGYVRPDAPDIGAFEFGGTIPATLANISTRLRVESGDDVLIAGFIVTGAQSKPLMVRGLGPSLPVAGALADPQLEIYSGNGNLVATNDNWQQAANKQAMIDTGIAPSSELEAAFLASLIPGAYTAVLSGVNNTAGIGLVEVYDLDRTLGSKLANISTRGVVQTGDDVMIAGFIVTGPDPQRVIIRAIGPSLSIAGKLADPLLELYDSNGTLAGTNDNWRGGGQEAEIIATGVPPGDDLESAAVNTLGPGGYTALVRGVSDATGIALVEVYGIR
jgi:predicted outer membrane repeat protein